MAGYTQTELDDVQAKWELRFPPDLVAILRERRGVIEETGYRGNFDWIESPDDVIRSSLDWPLEGFSFDVRHGLWWPEWGEMPADEEERITQLQTIFAKAPKLIPVYGHRMISETPCEPGNPIFSVWQMDVIHYGANLDDYIARENVGHGVDVPWPPIKQIPFWSRAVEFNKERFADRGSFKFFNKGKILPE